MKNTYTANEVLELMDKVSVHFIIQNMELDEDFNELALLSMAITNVIFTGKYKPNKDEEGLLAIAKREKNGGYSKLLDNVF